ncbi:MAG: hypothetical protein ACM3XM_06235 [Mycobacterium leprae]
MNGASRNQRGDVSLYILGTVTLLLLVLFWSGLADSLRLMTLRALATRSLAAAVESAAREDLTDAAAVEDCLSSLLAANLGDRPYTAEVAILPEGGTDPLSGRQFDRAVVAARLELPVQLQYLTRWAPEMKLRLYSYQYSLKRKAGP